MIEANEIQVFLYPLPKNKSVSAAQGNCCYIGIDPLEIKNTAELNTHIAHELGHCMTQSFYNIYSPFDIRQKHELTADKWAVKKLIPKDKLLDAMKMGYTQLWQIAEFFDVTEAFVKRAFYIYFELQPMK